jgi:TonB family protein
MQRRSLFGFPLCLTILATLFSPNPALAQIWKLNETCAQLAKEIRPLKLKHVVVADFVSPDSTASPAMGHYFAILVSDLLRQSDKKHMDVLDHDAFDSALVKLHVAATANTPDFVQAMKIAPNDAFGKGADVLVLGTIGRQGGNYLVEITAMRRADGVPLIPVHVSMKLSEFLESFAAPFPAPEFEPAFKAGKNGMSMPHCTFCPNPTYNDFARKARIQGSSVLEIVISKEGRVLQLHPVKLLGYGLDEDAYNVLRQWQFTPTTNAEGVPVNVVVPVQISFRLFWQGASDRRK